MLTAEDCARYERMALEQLGPDCAPWLATGAAQPAMVAAGERLAA